MFFAKDFERQRNRKNQIGRLVRPSAKSSKIGNEKKRYKQRRGERLRRCHQIIRTVSIINRNDVLLLLLLLRYCFRVIQKLVRKQNPSSTQQNVHRSSQSEDFVSLKTAPTTITQRSIIGYFVLFSRTLLNNEITCVMPGSFDYLPALRAL